MISWRSMLILWLLLVPVLPQAAFGHAFPDHADPKVGATLTASPARVCIWFDSALEPAFSTITVRDASGKRVDAGHPAVNGSDGKLLEVTVPRLAAGTYLVLWSVVARDGHKTNGDYSFSVK